MRIDHWWQTSLVGYCRNFPEFGVFDIKYGSTGKPAPGFQVEVDDNGNSLEVEEMEGSYKVTTSTDVALVFNDSDRFYKAYLEKYKGYYNTSDAGVIDKEGYISVMSRTDDIINCAGHRISEGLLKKFLPLMKKLQNVQ